LKLAVLFTLLWLIFRDVLSTGELIAMQFISVAILAPLQELGNIILAWREAEASLAEFRGADGQADRAAAGVAVSIGPVDARCALRT
jgi:ATP-binding cassette subfamily B protein